MPAGIIDGGGINMYCCAHIRVDGQLANYGLQHEIVMNENKLWN